MRALILLVCVLATAVMADDATGVVYRDANANGQRDAGEAGIAGVAVSNGREVVQTDDAGRYRLPVEGRTVIFVTKPDGYDVPRSKVNLPQFYYVHAPDGDPALYYPGSPPTGPLPATIDFALVPGKPTPRFSIVALADTQPESSQEVAYVARDVLSELLGAEHAFGVTLGDIMFDNLTLLTPYNALVGRLGFPFYNIVGNHDLNFDAANDPDSMVTYVHTYGPPNFSWDMGEVHFVALDSILFKGRRPGKRIYDEGFDERALTWLANDLKHVDPDRLIVLCTHAPIHYLYRGKMTSCANAAVLLDTLKDRNVLALSGHTHYTFQTWLTDKEGWHGKGSFHQLNCVTVSGSWWSGPHDERDIPAADQIDGTPNGYTVIAFDGATYQVRYKAARFPADHQMRIYAPGAHGNGSAPERTVLANLFYGTPRSTVSCRVNEGPSMPMTLKPQLDPLAIRYYGDGATSGKPWLRPELAMHMWEARLPDALPSGIHTVRVTAEIDGTHYTSAILYYQR